ncbi:MAG TPA: hypothetical protein VGZ93_10780 [Candidatus Methylacidiphilales bacterium]|nr:hypothetical protein [Candidatus Methylacidiphilales bacterium]
MLVLGWLCRWFPSLRWFFIGIGYVMLIIGGVVWFVCFPMTAYTLYVARQFPLTYFGIPFSPPFPLDFFLPPDMLPLLVPVCLAFTLFGLFTIYFNVRNLRRLKLGQN